MEQRKRKSSKTVASIETEYVRSLRKKEIWRNKQKRRLKKKLFIYAIIAIAVFGGLTNMFIQQKQTLQDKEQQKKEMLAQLEEVKEEQDLLKKQLVKLDDDDYIAKLARKEYFLSDKNEIIFSVPEKKKKNDEKDDGKE
ncbi:cell division protein DIVIC [Sporosarcina luteola]|uniref:Cell division protein DIVIC n=1 Tax=Sporosarcina luteola TaxID=582850 RepID=A0A511ZCC5_9BACL|nr:septum formation initiator family protein [Sporosarcina luteola]GEN85107.1 cell division protein DIVIC [Sporosarcina luteola]